MRILSIIISLAFAVSAQATEIKVLATTAMKPLLTTIQPRFETATGLTLAITWAPGPDLVRDQILAGAEVDVAISSTKALSDLVKAGKIPTGGDACIAQTTMGVGVRKGDANLDLSTPEKFKNAMLNSTSIAYATEGRSGPHFLAQLEKLGITDAMKTKLRPMTTPTAVAALAKGEVQYVALLLSNILTAQGIDLGSTFPAELQLYNRFAAGSLSSAKNQGSANLLVQYLNSAKADDALVSSGLTPCIF